MKSIMFGATALLLSGTAMAATIVMANLPSLIVVPPSVLVVSCKRGGAGVPRDTARLRISLSAAHTPADVARLAAALLERVR